MASQKRSVRLTEDEIHDAWMATEQVNHVPSISSFARIIEAKLAEKCAALCERSDRYRGDYFAALIRTGVKEEAHV